MENSLALMLNQVNQGRCTIEQVVQWMCDAPARVWDVVNKGRIAVGCDADLVLVDMQRQAPVFNENQQTKCGWSPWHGETLTGWPVRTWVMGREVYRDGSFDDLGPEAKLSLTIREAGTGRKAAFQVRPTEPPGVKHCKSQLLCSGPVAYG